MINDGLTFTSLWANSADDKLRIFSYFSQKTGIDISIKLSSQETICITYQSLFSGQNKKKNSVCYLPKILPSMLSVNWQKKTKNSTFCHSFSAWSEM